jgi:hypothetical protein
MWTPPRLTTLLVPALNAWFGITVFAERGTNSMMTRQLLSAEGMTEFRQAIRKERSERRETAQYWLKIIGGFIGILTGLTGALIGLFSVLKHK